MNGLKLLQQPHRPPLIQIKKKTFRFIDGKKIYPIMIKDAVNKTFNSVNLFSAPYYGKDEVYNVYVAFETYNQANIMAENIGKYYNISCEPIEQLRKDMEYYSVITKTPLVVITGYLVLEDTYELYYYSHNNDKDKNILSDIK